MTDEQFRIYNLMIDLDMDYKSAPAVRRKGKEIAERLFQVSLFLPIALVSIDVKETTGGFHIRIELSSSLELNDKDIVFLQLLLGSDWRREVFNFRRIHEGVFADNWNVLFLEKRRGGRIVSWEQSTELADELKLSIVENYKNLMSMVRGDTDEGQS